MNTMDSPERLWRTQFDKQLTNETTERVGLIRSRGYPTRGGYDAEDGCERRPRDAIAAAVLG